MRILLLVKDVSRRQFRPVADGRLEVTTKNGVPRVQNIQNTTRYV